MARFKHDPAKPFYCDECLPIMREKMRLQSTSPSFNVIARKPKADEAISPQMRSPRPSGAREDRKVERARDDRKVERARDDRDGEFVQKEIPKQTVSLSALTPRPAKKEPAVKSLAQDRGGRPLKGEAKEGERVEL